MVHVHFLNYEIATKKVRVQYLEIVYYPIFSLMLKVVLFTPEDKDCLSSFILEFQAIIHKFEIRISKDPFLIPNSAYLGV